MADRFYIGPYDSDSGLQTNYKPFVIPEKAFAYLQNAYVFRGRVRKRFGSAWLGNTQKETRLRVNIGTTDGAGNFAGFVPLSGGVPIVTPAIGQMFSIGDQYFTVNVIGAPANLLRTDGGAVGANATFNNANGAVVINTNIAGVTPQPGVGVYYYPALPVMGLLTQETTAINSEPTIAFDTKFAYRYIALSGWERLAVEATAGAATWNGSNSQFFWGANYSGLEPSDLILFVTNFNENEPNFMRYLFNGIWNNFRPQISAYNPGPPTLILGIKLDAALMIVPFKNHLVALNTWESSTSDGINYTQQNYSNRARWSQIGSPLELVAGAPPEITLAWRQDLKGRGGGYDAPTRESIVSAEFVKDRLIVYFEKSTWELVYTNNAALPFVWQQINTELGAESTFSIVPFDKVALGVGNVGIHACNGQNTERIDARIPQLVFDIHNADEGVQRVYGIRDYTVEMVYWTFPSDTADTDQPYPNRILVYNYLDNTWSLNDDSITVFGYFQPTLGVTWDSTTVTWSDDQPWESGVVQPFFRQVVAGNQEGWTFSIQPDDPFNAPALQVTDITNYGLGFVTITAIDHNLRLNDYVLIDDIVDSDPAGNLETMNATIGLVTEVFTKDTFKLNFVPLEPQDPPYVPILYTGTYAGGANLTRVSNIQIQTKAYNFYAQKGRNAFVSRIDFLVDREDGEPREDFIGITVDYYVSTNIKQMLPASRISGTLIGTGILETTAYPDVEFEEDAEQVWHAIYMTADGEYIQLNMYLSDAQMRDLDVWQANFELHAMIIHAEPSSMRLQ